jgi:hypothetical protein
MVEAAATRHGHAAHRQRAFGESDLAFGGLDAVRQNLPSGLASDAMRSARLRRCDNVLGLALGAGVAGFVFREQLSGFFVRRRAASIRRDAVA